MSAKARKLATLAGCDIENAGRAVFEHETNDLGNVVDVDMVAALFALAEQNNGFAAIGLTAEAVRPIAVVRIAGAIDQCRTQDGERGRAGTASNICSRARCMAPCRLVGAAGETSVSGNGPSA